MPRSKIDLWHLLAKSFKNRNELRGILAGFGLSVRGSRADGEQRLATFLDSNDKCPTTLEMLRNLANALPASIAEEVAELISSL